jgi:hypothetical protein
MKYMGYRQEVWEKVPGLEDAHAAKGANPE